MLDAYLRPHIDPHLNILARKLLPYGITANQLTMIGVMVALAMIMTLASGWFFLSLILLGVNRVIDGVDGPLARLYHPVVSGSRQSSDDFGGFFDIVADYVFYAGVPLGFALYNPSGNGAAAAFLLFSFVLTAVTFLAFATMAAKRGLSTEAQGQKSFYYLSGLMEGSETIGFFVLMCLFAPFFDVLANLFAILCCVSAGGRVLSAKRMLR